MKLVFLAPEAVFPANTGGRIVVYNKIKNLSKLGYEIFLFCVVDSDDEKQQVSDEMGKYCCFCGLYNRGSQRVRRFANSILRPYAVGSRTIKKLKDDLNRILSNEEIDFIWCEMPQMAMNLKGIHIKKHTRCVLSQQNIEFKTMRSLALTFKNPIKKLVYLFDSKRFHLYEKKLYSSGLFDAFVFVSDDDKAFFARHFSFSDKPLITVPIGAEKHTVIPKEKTHNCLIVGKMSYPPNIEGVSWFVNRVWQEVKERIPDAHLYIVGKDPDSSIRSIQDDSITVTGTVDSVEDYYLNAAVAIVPLFSGGGVKTKLIEAVSYNIPVVCTSFGAIGTMFRNQEHIFISDEPDSFAQGICECLSDNDTVRNRAKRAFAVFEKHYSWEGIVEGLNTFLCGLVQ